LLQAGKVLQFGGEFMSRILSFAALVPMLASAAFVVPASAQEAPPTVINFPVTGFVTRLCSIGAVTGGNGTYALGSLIDPTTGLLSSALSAPAKIVTGSWCNAPSTISVGATQLTATGFTGTAPAGFTSAVDFTASASGWSTTPASFTTSAAANAAATQPASSATSGAITVGIGSFAARGGANLRPVAANAYSGQVVLTLAIVP
jgi:hypothetical protein